MGKPRSNRALPLRACCIVAVLLLLTNGSTLRAAEYKGRNLDGTLFDAIVSAQDTGRRYEVKVEFDEDHAIVIFPPCMRLLLALDDTEIVNPQKIPALDVERGVHWEISIDRGSLKP